MAEFDDAGWFKTHRTMLCHPVFTGKRAAAAMTFLWMLGAAAHKPRVDRSFSRPFEVRRGQLVTSIHEVVERLGFSAKQVRNAFAWLERETMIRREDCRSAGCSLVTIVNYEQYQKRDQDDDIPLEGEETQEAARKKGQTKGHTQGHSAQGKKGKPEKREKPLSRKGKTDARSEVGANPDGEKGHAEGHTQGQASLYKDEEVKETKNIPPNPPLKKGGRSASDSSGLLGGAEARYRMVLEMWREERLLAGLDYQEDRNTAAGARTLADEYLGCARLSAEQLRSGMRKLIHDIMTDPKCRRYDLRTLANNPSKFCPPPPIKKPLRKKVRWHMVCDVCGHGLWTDWRAAPAGPPAAEPCPRSFRNYCQGTMLVEKEEVALS